MTTSTLTSLPTARSRPFVTPVRGHAYAAAPPDGGSLEPGRGVRLVREPTNPADPLAVAVWTDPDGEPAWRIGYLDRGVAARVAPRLDAGTRARAELEGWSPEPDGRWHRPAIRVMLERPAPPPAAHRAARTDATRTGRGLWGRPPGVVRRRVGG